MIEPIGERQLLPCSYTDRPGEGPARANRRLSHELRRRDLAVVVRRDIERCLPSIAHAAVRRAWRTMLPGDSLDGWLEAWLQAQPVAGARAQPESAPGDEGLGIAQGSVLGPLVSSIVLHELDQQMLQVLGDRGELLRYSDDLLVLARDECVAEQAVAEMVRVLGTLGLRLKPASPAWHRAADAFEYLGIRFEAGRRSIAPDRLPRISEDLRRIVRRLHPARVHLIITELRESLDGIVHYYAPLVDAASLQSIDRDLADAIAAEAAKLEAAPLRVMREALETLPWLSAERRADRRELIARALRPPHRPPSPRAVRQRQQRLARALEMRGRELHVVTPGAYVGRRGQRLVVRLEGAQIASVRASDVDHIVLAAPGSDCSRAVVQWAASAAVPITYLDASGRTIARTEGARGPSASLVRAQIRVLETAWHPATAREIVRTKLRSQVKLIRYPSKYEDRSRPGFLIFAGMMSRRVAEIEKSLRHVSGHTLDVARPRLLAAEGQAAILYSEGFRLLLDGRAPVAGRERRGADDLVNSTLNYGYGILYARLENACVRRELDPTLSILQTERPGKASLTSDLIEPFRAPIVDRTVLTLIRRRRSLTQDASSRLSESTRRLVSRQVLRRLAAYTRYRTRGITLQEALDAQVQEFAEAIQTEPPYGSSSRPGEP